MGVLQQLLDFLLNLLEERVEEALHQAVWQFNTGRTLLYQLLLLRLVLVVSCDNLLQHGSTQVFTHVAQLEPGLHTGVELSLQHLEVFQDVQPGRCVLVVAFCQLWSEEILKEHFEMLIHELAAPLASTTRWKEFVAHELLVGLALEFVYGYINGSTTAIKDHDDRVLRHLVLETLLRVVSALDRCTFRFQAKKEVRTAELADDASLQRGLAHELLLVLGPECGHSQHPADLVLLYLTDLLGQLLDGLVRDEPQ